jgi:hypothetical protein
MKQFLKNNWFKLSLLFIVVFIISGAFYWFQIRPSQIVRDCYYASRGSGLKSLGKSEIINTTKYLNCLKEHGLSK